tara:strand:- start:355 stop:975 length:621 start_codon:yes stop_codon:yes gene_type:complete
MIIAAADLEIGTWSWSLEDDRVTFSPNWFLSLGYEVPNNLNQHLETWKKLIHPDDFTDMMPLLHAHWSGRTAFYQFENRLLMQSGRYRRNLAIGMVFVRSQDGKPLKMCGLDVDLEQTEIKTLYEHQLEILNSKFTGKEKQICELVKRGFTNEEIQFTLKIAKGTVNTHLKNIYKKAEVNNRSSLISYLYKTNFFELLPNTTSCND